MKKYLLLFVVLPTLMMAMENELTSEDKKVIVEKLLNLADNKTTWPEFCTFLKDNQQNVDRYWKILSPERRTSLNLLFLNKEQEHIRQQEITCLENILKDISKSNQQ